MEKVECAVKCCAVGRTVSGTGHPILYFYSTCETVDSTCALTGENCSALSPVRCVCCEGVDPCRLAEQRQKRGARSITTYNYDVDDTDACKVTTTTPVTRH